jgi:HlyD family secretion protein
MNLNIFRKVSLARLASPEQLDEILVVTSPKGWYALIGIFLLLAVALIWGYTGSLPTKASGQGVVVRQGGVLNIVTNGSGMLIALNVNVGDHVHKNEVIARVAQPEQLEKIKMTSDQLAEARRTRDRAINIRKQAASLSLASIERQRLNMQRQISELEAQSKLVAERIPIAEQLLTKGLVTRQSVVDARQKLVDVQGQAANIRTQLTELDSQRYTAESGPLQTESDTRGQVSELERNLAELRKQLELTADVVSPYDGEVIETKVYLGSTVSAGMPLVSVQPTIPNLELLVYLPASQAKDARQGMAVQISPTTVKREEYGFMRGKVVFVSDYPATPAALMRNFQNEGLVSSLTNQGPVTEVRVRMQQDSTTASGYEWSSGKGPPTPITSGSMCTVDIVTRQQKPITMLFPYIKAKLGLS